MSNSRGYIAVVSAVILSSVLLLCVFANSMEIFWARYSQLAFQNKIQNAALANSCAYEALLEYTEDTGSVTAHQQIPITDSGENCTIDSLVTTKIGLTLLTHANTNSVYSGISISANFGYEVLSITSWRDITSIPP